MTSAQADFFPDRGAIRSAVATVSALSQQYLYFYPRLVPLTGGHKGALVLSNMLHWTRHLAVKEPERDGWVWKTQAEWSRDTGLSRHELDSAIAQLKAKRILQVIKRGMPATTFYQLQLRALGEALGDHLQIDPGTFTWTWDNSAAIRFAGSDKLRVEDIENKRTQLLTTHAIELVTVQPRPGEVAVTVAGIGREPISMWELWQRRKLNRNAAGINTSFLLGVQEISGSLLYLNLGSDFEGQSVHEPHTLIAGTTGSGKSVLIQTLMLDIAATNPPELAQITLVDPKMGVDYLALADLPHMREDVIIDKAKAAEILDGLVQEMEARYRAFAQAKARDLAAYNAKAAPGEALPMLFLVHDEFADWMLDKDYADAVGAAVQRLGVKARAAGIHLVFCAQRPDKDVMPMQLRENLGNRLALKVTSAATSRIVLDQGGAEQLLGRGHLAARLAGDGLVIAQCPYMGDADVQLVVDAVRCQ